jgi:hypothetical protein
MLAVILLVGQIDPGAQATGNRDNARQTNPARHEAGATLKMPLCMDPQKKPAGQGAQAVMPAMLA